MGLRASRSPRDIQVLNGYTKAKNGKINLKHVPEAPIDK